MKSTIPQRIPNSTTLEWSPRILASRDTSRHHWALTTNNPTTDSLKFNPAPPINQYTPLTVILRANIALKIGHGELSTKWNECRDLSAISSNSNKLLFRKK